MLFDSQMVYRITTNGLYFTQTFLPYKFYKESPADPVL